MAFEFQILDFFQTLHTPVLDTILGVFSKIGNMGMVWVLLAIILLAVKKTRRLGIMVAIALIAELLITDVCLKHLVARVRPYDIKQPLHALAFQMHDYSFPSGHAGASIASVTALYLGDREKKEFSWLWKISLLVGIIISFSRMYFYVHYPTDILGGVLVGLLDGVIANYLVGRFFYRD